MKKIRKKKMTADDIADLADRGGDVSKYFAGKGKMMKGLARDDIQRVNVDFTEEILSELDAEARRLNISRQAVIKTLIAGALDQKALARERKRLNQEDEKKSA